LSNADVRVFFNSNATINGNISGRIWASGSAIANERTNVTVNGNLNGNVILSGSDSMGTFYRNANITINGVVTATEPFLTILYGNPFQRTIEQYDSIEVINGNSFYRFIDTDTGTNVVLVKTQAVSANSIGAGIEQALASGEALVLTTGASTNITAADLQKIKDSEGVLDIQLPNGVRISIDSATIGANPVPIDLNIAVTVTSNATTINGVQVPANSLIIAPSTHGVYGFTIEIHITAAKLAEVGLNGNNVRFFYIASDGVVTEQSRIKRETDGSVIISIDRASRYVLSATAPARGGGAPQTGDYRTIFLPILMIIFGVLGLGGWVLYIKRSKKKIFTI